MGGAGRGWWLGAVGCGWVRVFDRSFMFSFCFCFCFYLHIRIPVGVYSYFELRTQRERRRASHTHAYPCVFAYLGYTPLRRPAQAQDGRRSALGAPRA